MMIQLFSILIYFNIYSIRISNTELIVQPSESIIFREQFQPFIALCSAERNTRVVSWQSPTRMVIKENNHDRVTVEQKTFGLRLRIRNLTENDQGTWKCLGLDQNGNSIYRNFQINVKIPIRFLSEPIQYAKLHSTVVIKCQINGNPSVEISWFKGKNKDEITSSNYQQTGEGLKIYRISSSDNDIFWCQADLVETGESKDFPIELIIAQSISSTRIICLSPCGVEKRTTTLVCEANGNPKVQYRWSYGQNSPFFSNEDSKYVIRGNRLIINQVDQTDIGRYTCHAFNDYDKIGETTEYQLNVIIPPELLPIQPVEISIDDDYSSQRVSFSCRVQRGSTENLSLEWFYPNETLVQSINGISIDSTNRFSQLNFDPVRREHHGNYTCLAKNSADTATIDAQLFILYKPIYLGSRTDNLVFGTTNHPVILKCQFDSSPAAHLQWFKIFSEHNEMILDEDYPQVIQIVNNQISSTIYETQLKYKPLAEDFDLKFECRADNSRIEKHFLVLRQAEPPGQPQIISLEPNSTSIRIFTQPSKETGGLPLIHYAVLYLQIDTQLSNTVTITPNLTNGSQLIELNHLQPATSYRIQVAAETQAGRGVFSTPAQAVTLVGSVPVFSIENNSCSECTSCLIKWILEDTGGTPISSATITYASTIKAKSRQKQIHIDGKTSEYQLNGLDLSKNNYLITVTLTNKAGTSERTIEKNMNTVQIKCKSKHSPSVWFVILLIFGILLPFGLLLGVVIWIRCCRQRPTDSQGENTTRDDCASEGLIES